MGYAIFTPGDKNGQEWEGGNSGLLHRGYTGLDDKGRTADGYGILFPEYVFECHCLSYHHGKIPPYFVIYGDGDDNNNNNDNDNDYNHNNDANNGNNENNNDKSGPDSMPVTV